MDNESMWVHMVAQSGRKMSHHFDFKHIFVQQIWVYFCNFWTCIQQGIETLYCPSSMRMQSNQWCMRWFQA